MVYFYLFYFVIVIITTSLLVRPTIRPTIRLQLCSFFPDLLRNGRVFPPFQKWYFW